MKPKKPGYDISTEQDKLVKSVCTFFGRVYDDFEEERHLALRGHRPDDEKWIEIMGDDVTINETAKEFHITPMKVRKLLIVGGCYDTEFFRTISSLRTEGLSVEEIAEKLKKSPLTVRSYLPIERVIYKLDERSVNADRLVRFKEKWGGYKALPAASLVSTPQLSTDSTVSLEDAEREKVVADLQANLHSPDASLYLWKTIICFEGVEFTTSGRGSRPGIKFTYEVSKSGSAGGRHYEGEVVEGYGNEMWITTLPDKVRKEKSISRSTVDLALRTALALEGFVSGPKKLNVPGAGSYLYPMFVRFGVINSSAE